ncbi:MAG TPA: hypothetical protein PLJ21_09355 [Pseudobdellovibrionaceae bacterium]|nr:hypothetical protein [Pseudobdellovibrionaceae bacterium]
MFQEIRKEIKKAKLILKESGLKALFRQYGWKLGIIVFFYYLIRDSLLYIIIPYFVAQKFID